MSGFILAVLVVVYVFSLQAQLREVRANQQNYEEEMASLSSVKNTDALECESGFFRALFHLSNHS